MSSLSSQLKSINDKTASVALDRKTRSQIHSRSLIFDPKVASTQDFDYLFQLGLEGLDELSEIDSRFNRFRQTLFSDTSINFDRNVQTKDTLTQINKSIDAFLNLVSPYYGLNPTVKTLEWLVRRFHINIHNAEHFILTALPYHRDSIFVKILNIVPKNQFPNIFSWLIGFKDQLKAPPANSILKAFYNDYPLYNMYTEYLLQQLANGTVYKEQLVFYLSITIQLLASLSKKADTLNEMYLPLILKVVGHLLLTNDSKYSSSMKIDTRLSAYSIISILTSIVPLSSKLTESLTESILQNSNVFDTNLARQSLIVLGQLWNFNNESGSTVNCFKQLSIPTLLKHESLINELIADDYKLSRFLTTYFINTFPNTDSLKLFRLIPTSQISISAITNLIFANINSSQDEQIRNNLIQIIEQSGDNLVESFTSEQVQELEMKLMTTLGNKIVIDITNDVDFEGSEEDNGDLEDVDEQVLESIDNIESTSVSFILSENNEQFYKLVNILLNQLVKANHKIKTQKSIIATFTKKLFTSQDSSISFLLRLALSPSTSTLIALSTIRVLKLKLKELTSSKASTTPLDLYLLIPILLLGLRDARPSIRQGFVNLLSIVKDVTKSTHEGKKKVKSTLFMENEIYHHIEASKRAILPPNDAVLLCDLIFENIEDVILTPTALNGLLFNHVFKSSKNNSKKFGQLILKTFILNQWSLESWSIVFKYNIWSIIAQENEVGTDDRYFFVDTDLQNYFQNRPTILQQCKQAKIDFTKVETDIVGLVGGISTNDKNSIREVEWFNNGLESAYPNLQITINERSIKVFDKFKSTDLKLKVVSKLIELLVGNSNTEIDPLDTLQKLSIDHDLFLSALSLVQIGTQIPEQGLAKRRRRSSNSTKQAMVKEDISNIASVHLKKLTIVLDILEYNLRKEASVLGHPDLLKALFKILTDLDYLGNDGNLPVLYAQETLANCMSLTISNMKSSDKQFKFDSNSIRADLIVNSIRASQSPQVQNRLLLVVAELASLAPEIILHSVMPIFTFMGAHTIRQDDEFSSLALQRTIAKVIPALATNGTSSIPNEIEFLLTSFVTAFHHIPRHRRVKLFTTLSKTLSAEKSLSILLFLMGQQYANSSNKAKSLECLEFTISFLKGFSALDQLSALNGFAQLWKLIPTTPLDPKSEEYKQLSTRSIYGGSILSLSEDGLTELSAGLLSFIELILKDDANNVGYSISSLKTKIAVVLLDSDSQELEISDLLKEFGNVTSFIIMSLDTFNDSQIILTRLYKLLSTFMDLLPLNYFIDSIIELLDIENLTDSVSIKVARNYVILAGSKFETELSTSNITESIKSSVVEKLLPILIKGIKGNIDVELQQSFLNTFSIIINKFGSELATSNSKLLIDALQASTSEQCLLSSETEVIISSISAIGNIVNILGVKTIGLLPKILPPALKIWQETTIENSQFDDDSAKLIQTSVIILLSCLIRKLPVFMTSSLDSILMAILTSDLVDNNLRSTVLELIVGHVELSQVLKSLTNIWSAKQFYTNDHAGNLGLYLKALESTIDKISKKGAISQSSIFVKWFIQALEFRHYIENDGDNKFDNNTIYRLEGSFHTCAITFVMKLNDKSFRPLFANLVRWAVDGEGANVESDKLSRLLAFFKFFNKLQDQLKGIVTTYYSYLMDATVSILDQFSQDKIKDVNLRRILLTSLNLSFKFDQDDYWTQQGRFESICDPLLGQLINIEDSIGKYLVKTITSFISNVASDEYNETLVHGLIKYVSNETGQNSSTTKIWAIRSLKAIFQKMGEQWLSYLPTLIPYIAELLEDDDETVELEVRNGLVRVIENVLGEPLDRYLG
ncbi:component of small subunit processosome [Scheffersomyces coipomensis]|uniref:component of small subunit processosome n=1 Tax=Scheffersomyces coipomensis TaxID=1788519 RepID=UPI00315DD7F3